MRLTKRSVKATLFVFLCLIGSQCVSAQIIQTAISSPTGIARDSDGNVWVASFGSSTVVKIKGDHSGTVLGTFSVGANPIGLAVDFINGAIWVSNYTSNTVTKLATSNGATLGTYFVGSGPRSLVWDGVSVWVANSNSNNVTRLDATPAGNGRVLGTYPVGIAPYGIAFDGIDIWVANRNSNSVMKLSGGGATVGMVLTTTFVAAQPQALAFDGTNMWVTSYSSHTLTKLDGNSGAPLNSYSSIPTGSFAVAVAPACAIWVAGYSSNAITAVNPDTGSITTFRAPSGPYGFLVEGCGTRILATSFTGNALVDFPLVQIQ
jgi:DNA-binding beta-propeller fold protein YncE